MDQKKNEDSNAKVIFAEKENRLRSKAAILDSYFMIMNDGMECYTKYMETGTVSTPLKFKWIQGCRSLLYQIMTEEPEFFEQWHISREHFNGVLSDIEKLHDFSLAIVKTKTVQAMRELSKDEIDPIEQYRQGAYK